MPRIRERTLYKPPDKLEITIYIYIPYTLLYTNTDHTIAVAMHKYGTPEFVVALLRCNGTLRP